MSATIDPRLEAALRLETIHRSAPIENSRQAWQPEQISHGSVHSDSSHTSPGERLVYINTYASYSPHTFGFVSILHGLVFLSVCLLTLLLGSKRVSWRLVAMVALLLVVSLFMAIWQNKFLFRR